MKRKDYLRCAIFLALFCCACWFGNLNGDFFWGVLAGSMIFLLMACSIGALIVKRTAEKVDSMAEQPLENVGDLEQIFGEK